MSNFSDIAAGIVTVLEGQISGLKGYDYLPHSINTFPAAVVVPGPVDYAVLIGGNTFETEITIKVLVASGDDAIGSRMLWDFIDPTDTTRSIRRAIRTDRTLNGKADDSDVDRCENIGWQELPGGRYYAADFILSVIKTVS